MKNNKKRNRMTNKPNSGNDSDILHQRIRTEENGEQLLPLAEREIERICDSINAPEATKTVAEAIYRRVIKEKVVQNRTLGEISAASVYAAYRVEGKPISLSEISAFSPAINRYISRTFTELSRELNLKVGPVDPTDFVPRICEEMNLSEDTEKKSVEILQKAIDEQLHIGKSPAGFAAAGVYTAALISGESRTQSEVADVVNVNVRSLRDLYQEQVETVLELEKSEDPEVN